MRIIALGTVALGLTLALAAGEVRAQAAHDRCAGGNPAIRTWLEEGRFPEPLVRRNPLHALGLRWNTSNARWATSHLSTSGTPPTSLRPFPGLSRELMGWTRFPVDSADLAHALWTCQYSADRLTDYDTTTAWCEGVPGDGIREVALFAPGFGYQDDPVGFLIWTGYGKSEALFRANGRPREIRVWHLNTSSEDPLVTTAQGETAYRDLSVVTTQRIELQDVNGWQRFPFPGGAAIRYGAVVAIEIRSVYPGSRFRDTCISEIRLEFPPSDGEP